MNQISRALNENNVLADVPARLHQEVSKTVREKLGASEEGEGLKEEVDALEALKSLGYSHSEAREALKNIPKEFIGTSDRVKAALKLLGR